MTAHAYPRPGATTTPCCHQPPGGLPIGDRLVVQADKVTCGREGAQDARYGVQNAMTGRAGVIGRTDDRKAAE